MLMISRLEFEPTTLTITNQNFTMHAHIVINHLLFIQYLSFYSLVTFTLIFVSLSHFGYLVLSSEMGKDNFRIALLTSL